MAKKRSRKRIRQVKSVIARKVAADKKRAGKAAGAKQQSAPAMLDLDAAKLIDLAIDIWKLEKHIKKALPLDDNRPVKSSLGKLFAYLAYYGIEVRDYTGDTFYENMNVRLLSTEEVEGLAVPTVIDTVKPAVIVQGALVSHASVIVGVPMSKQDDVDEESEGSGSE